MGKKNTSGEASVPATSSDFPRGGAASGALTSLEWRDASERAAKELFNEANEAAAVEGGSGGDKAKKKKKKRVQEQEAPEPKRAKVDAAEKKESIASLTFKKLNPGFTLLGVIKDISDLELTLSLPNQMTGSVSITEISDEITAIVERVAQVEEGQERGNEDNEDAMNVDAELPALNHLFKIGQALPVLAISTEKASAEGGSSKRKIELSIKPARMNASVEVDEIREGMNLLASVKSVEDNGYILSFGFKSNSTTHGFLHKKHASAFVKSFDASIEKKTLAVGQVIYVSVLSVDAGKRTISVTADPEAVARSVVPTSHNLAFPSLRPGLLIPTRVKSILDGSGVILSFMGLFEGTIELGHLGDKARDGTELEKAFKVGQKLQPRILYVDSVRKRIGFTLLPSIVSWTTEMALATLQETEIGTILENTTVSRVDGELGLVMSVENGLTGYVHVSRLTDKDDAKIEPSKKHAPGTTHKTRVVGYDVCDNLLQLTMKPSVLNATFMRRSDVKVGMIVKGTVTKVEDYGLMVSLADGISALVPKTHLAENTVANPSKMFKIGSSVKARVLSVNAEKRRIALTLKKSLVNSTLPLVSEYTTAHVDQVADGFIVSVLPFGCIVGFYNDVKALVPLRELSNLFVSDPKAMFNPGAVVRCRVLSVDEAAVKMTASFKQAGEAVGAAETAFASAKLVKVGDLSQAKVLAIVQESVLVELMPSGARAMLNKEHLSDHLGHVDALFAALGKDSLVKSVVVIHVDEKKDRVTVSAKPLLLEQQKAGIGANSVKVGELLFGYVKSCTEKLCFVGLPGDSTGVAKLMHISDQFVKNVSENFTLGQTVVASVIAVDEVGKVEVSLKPSVISSVEAVAKPDAHYLSSYFSEEDKLQLAKADSEVAEWCSKYAIGSIVDGVVKQRTPYGFIVTFDGNAASGLLTVEVGKSTNTQVGDSVKARIVDVDFGKKIVDLRLLSGAKDSSTDEATAKKIKSAVDSSQSVDAVVEGIKPAYLILSLPTLGNRIAYAPVKSFNTMGSSLASAAYRMSQKIKVTLIKAPSAKAGKSKKFDGLAIRRLIVSVNPSSVIETAAKSTNGVRPIADPVDPCLTVLEDLTYGTVVKGKIHSVRPMQMNVTLGSNLKGRVHVTELVDTIDDIQNVKQPFGKLKAGQILTFKVVGFHQEGKSSKFLPISHRNPTASTVVELTLRKKDMAIESAELATPVQSRYPTIATIEEGSRHLGFVQAVKERFIMVSLSPTVHGRVVALETSTDIDVVRNLDKHFKEGMAIHVLVLGRNVEKSAIDLSIRAANAKVSALVTYPLSSKTIKPGFKCVGAVAKVVASKGLTVKLADRLSGHASLFEISDEMPIDPTISYKEGDYVSCRVIQVNETSGAIQLTMRPSRVLNKDTLADSKVVEDSVVKGYVTSVASSGVFVDLGNGYAGRVLIKNVTDDYVKDWQSVVDVGDVVTARVLSVDEKSRKADISLKKTDIDPNYKHVKRNSNGSSAGSSMSISDLTEGMKVTGTVTSIHQFGVFIKIDDTNLKGLCHSSQLSDKPISKIDSLYAIGDPVMAVVLKVDLDKKRINFGLKASYFTEDDVAATEDDDKADVADETDEDEDDLEEFDADGMDVDEKDNEEEEDTEGEGEGEWEDNDGEEDDDDVEGEMALDGGDDEAIIRTASKRGLASVKQLEPLDLGGAGWGDIEDSDEDLQKDHESDSDDEETTNNESKKSRRAKKRAKQDEEERIALQEQELLEVKAPDSAEAFDRILMGSPSSSFLWIKFMAFHLQMAEIGKAREVGERALKSISFREPQELMNVWVAMLNLENTYGDRESLMKVFERAIAYNEPKATFLNLANIYERSNNVDELDSLFQVMVKRFKESCKVWVAYGLSLLKRGKVAESRKILERSMKSLAKRKHLKVVCKFAQIEFKYGEPERGRTLFEGIVSNHPKRLDMWSVYLDMEIRNGDVAYTRRLFERAIALKLSSKKMKFLFKKYLEFEKSKGTPDGVQHVKEAAMDYVERISS